LDRQIIRSHAIAVHAKSDGFFDIPNEVADPRQDMYAGKIPLTR